jgi:hypothetical protein
VFSDDEQPVLELTQEEYSKWMNDRLACQRVVLDVARELQQAYDKNHLEDYNPEDLTSFQINDLVLVRPVNNPLSGRRPKDKFAMFWSGPYRVVGRSGDMYTLQDLTMTETYIDRHVMDIKRFLQHELDATTPLDVALGDTDEFVVSEVLSHEGDPKDKRNMWFTVRWAGSRRARHDTGTVGKSSK